MARTSPRTIPLLVLLCCLPDLAGCRVGLEGDSDLPLLDDDSGAGQGDDDGTSDDDTVMDDDGTPDDDTGPDDDATSDDDGADDDTTPAGTVRVTSLYPDQGAPAGGEQVTVAGEGFTSASDTVVRFGGGVAAIASVTPTEMLVFTPSGTAGVVDVRVENSNGSDTLEDCYTYLSDDVGLSGGMVDFLRFEVTDPSIYVDPVASVARGQAAFWAPDDLELWPDFYFAPPYPAEGECVEWDYDTAPGADFAFSPFDAGEPISFVGTTTLTLPHGVEPGTDWYYTADLPFSAFEAASTYDLSIPGGGDVPGQVHVDAIQTPPDLHLEPPLDNYAAHSFNRTSGLGLTLGAPATADHVFVSLLLYGAPTFTLDGGILCRFADGPSVTVPGTAFAGYSAGVAVVDVTRLNVREVALDSGARLKVVTRVVVDGALTMN